MKQAPILSVMMALFFCSAGFAVEKSQSLSDKTEVKSVNIGSPVTAVCGYDSGHSVFAGDNKGNVYTIDLNGSRNLFSFNGQIDSIVIGTKDTGILCFALEGRVYDYKGGKILDISTGLRDRVIFLYQEDGGGNVYALTKNNDVYILKGDDSSGGIFWQEVADSCTNAQVLEKSNSSRKGIRDSFLRSNAEVSNDDINCSASCNGREFFGSRDGKVYLTDNQDQALSFNISYVSPAYKDPGSAIYSITIKGKTIQNIDLCNKGLNGFRYRISAGIIPDTYAYPITGMHYQAGVKPTLTPRDISFFWKGPKGDGAKKVQITENTHNYESGSEDDIDTINKIIPSAVSSSYDYQIELNPLSGSSTTLNIIGTGTCAEPFIVKLKDNSTGKYLPSTDEAYKHIAFYLGDSSGYPTEDLIGCDSFDQNKNHMSILSDDSAEIDGKYIKYGNTWNISKEKGKVFYLYSKNDGLEPFSSKICAAFINKDGEVSGSGVGCLPVQTMNSSTEQFATDNGNLNFPGGRTFYAGDKITTAELLSNCEGNTSGYGGYIDYQLTQKKGDSNTNGVYIFFPEGLNTREYEKRKDIRSTAMTVGFYFTPAADGNNPMYAKTYHINDMTSYCKTTKGQKLYAVVFDIYGRCLTNYSVQDSNAAQGQWDSHDAWDCSDNNKMVVRVINKGMSPVIFGSSIDSPSDKLRGLSNRGVFVPPNGGEYQFLTDVVAYMDGSNDGTYVVEGSNFIRCTDNVICRNKMNLHFRKDSFVSTSYFYFDLYVGDADKWLLPGFEDTVTNSENSIHIWHPLWKQLRVLDWGVIYCDPSQMKDYNYYYSFKNGSGGTLPSTGSRTDFIYDGQLMYGSIDDCTWIWNSASLYVNQNTGEDQDPCPAQAL